MSTICLIRHGVTDWNMEGRFQGRMDIPLNESGRRQAREASEAIRGSDWDIVVSSPLARAYQTAEIVAKAVGISEIHTYEQFAERDLGVASGHLYEEMDARYPGGAFPGLESLDDLQKRVMHGFERTISRFPDKRIIIVAHAYSLNSILFTVSNGEVGTLDIPRVPHGYAATLHSEGNQWIIDDFRERK